jgi:hypothetical protein
MSEETSALPRRGGRNEEPMSRTTYWLHGATWLGAMLFMFWLAGLKF